MKKNLVAQTLAVLTLLAVPFAAAVLSVFEGFEDDTIGTAPTGDAYSLDNYGSCNGNTGTGEILVSDNQSIEGTQSLLLETCNLAQFNFTEADMCQLSTGDQIFRYYFYFDSAKAFDPDPTSMDAVLGDWVEDDFAVSGDTNAITHTGAELRAFEGEFKIRMGGGSLENPSPGGVSDVYPVEVDTWYEVTWSAATCSGTTEGIIISVFEASPRVEVWTDTFGSSTGFTSYKYFRIGPVTSVSDPLYVDALTDGVSPVGGGEEEEEEEETTPPIIGDADDVAADIDEFLGVGIEAAKWIIGIIIVAVVWKLFGGKDAHPVAAAVAVLLGIGFALAYGAIPEWFLLLVFLAVAVLVAMLLRTRGPAE